jgi:hypothetical protein
MKTNRQRKRDQRAREKAARTARRLDEEALRHRMAPIRPDSPGPRGHWLTVVPYTRFPDGDHL